MTDVTVVYWNLKDLRTSLADKTPEYILIYTHTSIY